jgi:hypothetical protein
MSNPYESPQEPHSNQGQPHQKLAGWALAKDTVFLVVFGLLASILGVPLLFAFFIVLSILWKEFFGNV